MKTNLLHIGLLSALLISGLSAEARRGSAKNNEAAKRADAERIDTGAREKRVQAEQRVNALLLVDQVSTISSKEAATIATVLATKANITNPSHINRIKEATLHNTTIGESLKKLSEKIRQNQNTESTQNPIKSEDVKIILEFAVNLKDVTPQSISTTNPHAANVVLGLVKNSYDMVSWPAASRKSALDLLAKINNNRENYTLSNALALALKDRGFESSRDRVKRELELRENCFK